MELAWQEIHASEKDSLICIILNWSFVTLHWVMRWIQDSNLLVDYLLMHKVTMELWEEFFRIMCW